MLPARTFCRASWYFWTGVSWIMMTRSVTVPSSTCRFFVRNKRPSPLPSFSIVRQDDMWRRCFISSLLHIALNVSVIGLERALLQYCSQPNKEPFDMKTVPINTAPSRDKMQCKSSSPLASSPLLSLHTFCLQLLVKPPQALPSRKELLLPRGRTSMQVSHYSI